MRVKSKIFRTWEAWVTGGVVVTSDSYRPRQIELLAKIEALFFAEGYRAATMSDLAQRLQCSKRSLYELAPSRKELFCLIVARWSARLRALGLSGESGAVSYRSRLAAFLEPGVTQTKMMTEAFLRDIRDLPAARAILVEHQRGRMFHLKGILEGGISAGAFKNVHSHLIAGILLAAIEKINDPVFLHEAGLGYSEAFGELYRVIITGLENYESQDSGLEPM